MSSIDPLTVNLDAATIQAAETLSAAAYDPLSAPGQGIAGLIADGWTEVPISDQNTNAVHNYQGIAFYKTINGVTQVIIANRGTTGLADAASDFDVALGITPLSDGDAEAYYNYVVRTVEALVPNANINVIETGHSLGGQEADWVVAQNNNPVSTEAVTFNGAGIDAGVAAGATNHNAVNIVNAGEGVHAAGTYDGNLVTVNGPSVPVGGSVAAAATEGFALAGVLGAAAGTIIGLYESAFSYNHKIQRITDYLRSDPALGGVDLQSYPPDQLNQSIVDFLANLSPSQYYGMTPSQKAALYSMLFNPGGSAGSPAPSDPGTVAETFTASGDSTGQTLTGSMGHVITTAFSGTTGTISNNDGYQETLNFSADGSAITSDTWNNASGAKGTDTYNADGSSASKVTYASGAYATVIDDGQGNITTDYFTKSGQETRSTWVHSDGSSGSVVEFDDGLSTAPGDATEVNESAAYILQNPDGSYSAIGDNASGTKTITAFAVDGSQTSQSSAQGSGVNDLAVASTSQVYSGGAEYTNQYNSAGTAIGDTWYSINPDGAGIYVSWAGAYCTSGAETLDASGVYVKNDIAVDGSSYRETVELNGTTVSHYNSSAQGVLLSDKWSDTDGSNTTPSVTGSDTFSTDGSGSGTFTDARDGTSGTVTLNGQGNIVVVNTDAGGTATSEDIWNADGSYEVAMLNADGSTQATYDYLANGDVTVTDLAPDGSIADQQTVAAGSVIDPDGTSFSKVANPDGSYTVYYQDAQGDTTAFQYGAGGQLTGSYHTTSGGDTWSGTLPDGTAWSTTTGNLYTPTYTDAQGNAWTDYWNTDSELTGADYVNAAAGTHGYITYGPNNAVYEVDYAADGTYDIYSNDGQGNVAEDFFDASGNETSDEWQNADGSHGSDTYNADGSSSGGWVNADGSYSNYKDDGLGDTAEIDFTAAGVKQSDEWANANGSYGSDIYNADGSYSAYSNDGQGDSSTINYSASGVKLSDAWTNANGTSGSDTFNADGSYSTTTNDGLGDSTTSNFNSSGTLTSDSWTLANGTTGSDTYNGGTNGNSQGNATTDSYAADGELTAVSWSSGDTAVTTSAVTQSNGSGVTTSTNSVDGSSSVTTTNANGSYSVAIGDGKGNSTTSNYSASGIELSDAWTLTNGTSGGDVYNADGSYSVTTRDSSGDTTTANYSASGVELSDSWTLVNGTSGSNTFNADGSYSATTNDGLGDTTTADYSSLGVELSGSWNKVDGTHGSETFNPDGSSTSTSYNRDGSYSQTGVDASGNKLTNFYSATGQLVSDAWVDANGTSGRDTFSGTPASANADFEKDGVHASYSGQYVPVTVSEFPPSLNGVETVFDAQGNALFSIDVEQIDVNNNYANVQYGGPLELGGAPDYQISSVQQSTAAPDGTQVWQTVLGLPYSNAGLPVQEGMTLADGTDLSSLWGSAGAIGYGVLAGQTVVSESGGPGMTAGAPQAYDIITASHGGLRVTNTATGQSIQYAGNPNAQDLSGPEPSVIIVPLSSQGQQSGSATSYDYTETFYYSGGGVEQLGVQGGWVAYDLQTDGHGDSSYSRGNESGWRNSAGYSWTSTYGNTVPDGTTLQALYPDGTVGIDSRPDSELMRDPSGVVAVETYAQPADTPGTNAQTVVTDQNGDTVTTNYNSTGWVWQTSTDATASSSWTTADGTQVMASFDLATGTSTERLNYTDGNHSEVSGDAEGGYVALNYDADGQLAGDQWQGDSGNSGTDVYNADGSRSGAIRQLDGSYETYAKDSSGTSTTTTYYSAGGAVVRSTVATVAAGGNTTIDAFDSTGVLTGSTVRYTNAAGNVVFNEYDANGAIMGSSVQVTTAAGTVTTTTYMGLDGSGAKLSERWIGSDGSHGSNMPNADASSNSVWLNGDGSFGTYYGPGNSTSDSYAASGVLTAVDWSSGNAYVTTTTANLADGSQVTTSINSVDGSRSVTTTNLDGSSSATISDGVGDSTTGNYAASGALIDDTWTLANGTSGRGTFKADGSYDVTTSDAQGDTTNDSYATDGMLSAVAWNTNDTYVTTTTTNQADGSRVITSVNSSDGSSSVTTTYADGSSSVAIGDGLGDTTTSNYSASGALTDDSWTLANGTSGSDTYNADGSRSTSISDLQGNTTADSYASSGELTTVVWSGGNADVTTNSVTESDGAVVTTSTNAFDGSSSVTTTNSDGSYSVAIGDGLGDSTTINYSAAGVELSESWTLANGSVGSSAPSNQTTDSYAADGMLTAVSWSSGDTDVTTSTATQPDGSVVTTSVNSVDGSSSVTTTYADGSSSVAIGDGLGDTTTSSYSASGALTGDSWALADGTSGSDTFNAGGSSSGGAVNADGSYSNYSDDGQGHSYSTDYSASGVLLHDAWSQSDGSYGTDSFDPATGATESTYDSQPATDGSILSTDVVTQANGSYVQNWSDSDGSSGINTLNTLTGEVTGSDIAAPGASYASESWDDTILANGAAESKYSQTYNDGSTLSTDTVTQADGSYVETWTRSDGSSGVNTLNAATGETTQSDTPAPGAGYVTESWDNTNLANGATESKYSLTSSSDGSIYSSDTVTQADGSYVETWSDTDGSAGTDTLDAATGETTASDTPAPGADYVIESWDNTNLAGGATESKYNQTYTDGSTFSSDTVTQTDGSIVESWSRSYGTFGTNYTTTSTSASDTYAWSADQGQDTIQASAGNDTLAIGAGVDADQLWFRQDGNNLDITVLGSSGQMTVEDWFANGANGLQGIELSNGQTLAAAGVNALVQAMAAFAPPAPGQLSYTAQEQTALAPVLAANWH